MDSTLLTKTISGGVLVAAVLVLVMTGKVDGPTALNTIQWIGVTFLGGVAVMGASTAIAGALAGPKALPALGQLLEVHPPDAVTIKAKPSSVPGPGPTAAILLFVGMLGFARLTVGCGGTLTPQQVTDITIGVNAAACVIEDGATDLAAGMPPAQIIDDLEHRCGATAAQIATLFDKEAAAQAKIGSAEASAKFATLASSAKAKSASPP